MDLLYKYPLIPIGLHIGFFVGLSNPMHLFTPSNNSSAEKFAPISKKIVNKEIRKGHYIGSFDCRKSHRSISNSPSVLHCQTGEIRQVLPYTNTIIPTHNYISGFSSVNSYVDPDLFPT